MSKERAAKPGVRRPRLPPVQQTVGAGPEEDTSLRALEDAAIEEFAGQPYASASLNEIIKRSGVSKGSLYYRFRNKLEIYLHVLESVMKAKKAHMAEFMSSRSESPHGFFGLMAASTEAAIDFARKNPRLAKLGTNFSREERLNPELYRTATSHLGQQGGDFYMQFIESAIASGELRSDMNPRVAASLLRCVLNNIQEIVQLSEKPETREAAEANTEDQDALLTLETAYRLVKDLFDILRTGLGVTDAGDTAPPDGLR